ncbi:tail fiber domain-containing protein [Chishuiella sp.]|uniref:tail fiber domain-containing protein n=1 Tax=Chishuiella sp. TaxID=1969467 RepID=UPI0028ACD95B|nr:tail fiber domain-containing protein [Chishuiella sp.]
MTDKTITINITDDDENLIAKVDKGQVAEVYSKKQSENYGIKNIFKTQLGTPTNNNLNVEYRNGTGNWSTGTSNAPSGYGTWVNFVGYGGDYTETNSWIAQFLFPTVLGDFYFRNKSGKDAWSSTYKVITSKDYTSLSKIKENIEDYKESALELINKLNIVKYDRIDTEQKGVIGILADADTTNECFLSPTKDYIDVYQTIFVLAKSTQELSKQINELMLEIKELKKITTSD